VIAQRAETHWSPVIELAEATVASTPENKPVKQAKHPERHVVVVRFCDAYLSARDFDILTGRE
jgi:hypothetical protein